MTAVSHNASSRASDPIENALDRLDQISGIQSVKVDRSGAALPHLRLGVIVEITPAFRKAIAAAAAPCTFSVEQVRPNILWRHDG